MFVYNVKVNGSRIFKIFFTGVVILVICITVIVSFRVFNGANDNEDSSSVSTCIKKGGICDISPRNYTNVLKAVHDDIDSYVGVKIHFSGYVYRVLDFNSNQFVLARDMIISSAFQTVVVGFLCECDSISNFESNSWVEITGEIVKGEYHGDMPIVKINDIKGIDKPNDEYVYPFDESYIPTSGLV